MKRWIRRGLTGLVFGLLLAGPGWAQQPAEETRDPQTTNAEAAEPGAAENAPGTEQNHRRFRRHGLHQNAIVSFGKPAVLKTNETADAVVVIGSGAKVYGKVNDAVVAIFGDVEVIGAEVGDAAVAVFGRVKLIDNARVRGDAVAVGGPVEVSEDSEVEGTIQSVDIGWVGGSNLLRFKGWFLHCFMKMRPLAIQVPWVWALGGFIFAVYLLIAAIFPRPVLACVGELTRRPITTLILGVVSLMLFSLLFLILAATGVGLLIAPFLMAAILFGFIVGKAATLEWIGLSIARQFGGEALAKPLIGLLFGGALIALLYLVPVLGLMTFGVFGVWALGSAVTATFTGLRKEAPEKRIPTNGIRPPGNGNPVVPPGPPPPPAPAPPMTPVAEPSISGAAPASENPGAIPAASTPMPAMSSSTGALAGVPEVLAYPRAGFWERMAATVLDVILLSIIAGFLHRPLPAFLLGIAYFVGMWTWKGTTIGGIVLGIKVVRADSQPLTLTTALVRALAGAFSAVVFFLGILWIAWDPEKQGWHDRIAGTLVLKLPRGTPLIVL